MPAPYKGFAHHVANSADQLAELAVELNNEDKTIYHACASFEKTQVMVKKRNKKTLEWEDKPAVRVADNAAWCKSFWVDLDVGAGDPDKYSTQREAAADLLRACKEIPLPTPMLVSSGYGVHAYWPLAEDLSAANWVRIAVRLKAVLHEVGVKQDPSRTSDVSSVLRPVGCSNRKNDDTKTVSLVLDAPDVTAGEFARAVVSAASRLNLTVSDVKKASQPNNFNNDLAHKVEYPPSSAHLVADKCQSIGHVRMMLGNVPEPFWRAAMGVVKHCVEGDELAHEWSQGHPTYDKYETQDKLDRWQVGPAMCDIFKPFGQCEGCVFAAKIKSPIQLGFKMPESDKRIEQPVPEAAKAPEKIQPVDAEGKVVLPDMPEDMREDFAYRKGVLYIRVPGSEDRPDTFKAVCQEYIVPYLIIRAYNDAKHGSKAILKCWRFTLTGRREEITLPFQAVAAGGKDLVSVFGEVGIAVEPAAMHKYMKGWIAELKRNSGDSLAADRMGWNDRGFVLGTSQFTPSGVEKAALASNLQGYLSSFEPSGSVERWADLINAAYNRPGQEQYQFLIACGFGSIFVPFLGDYRGVIVSAVSYKSGQGKTTAQRAALSIYGDPSRLETAYGRQTNNAMYEKLGAMGNLPFMIDEISNIESKDVAEMAYTISQGVQKDRLNKDGSMRAQREPWQTLVPTSGNRSLIQSLGAEGVQREPEMRRIFEFNFDVIADLNKTEADRIFNELRSHYGVAGPVFIDYVVRNKEAVEQLVLSIAERMNTVFNLQREERFWGVAISAAVAGAQIANKLGLIGFTAKGMLPWIKMALQELRVSVKASAGDEYDLVNHLTADMSFDLWVTQSAGVRNAKPAIVMREPRRGKVAGRLILDENLLLIRPEYVRQWCHERRADYRMLRQLFIKSGCFRNTDGSTAVRDVLGGIQGSTPLRGRVWFIDAQKMAEISPNLENMKHAVEQTNVVALREPAVS